MNKKIILEGPPNDFFDKLPIDGTGVIDSIPGAVWHALSIKDKVSANHTEKVYYRALVMLRLLEEVNYKGVHVTAGELALIKLLGIEHVARAIGAHDVGKVLIPDEILKSKGRLSAEEREIMELHTTLGRDIYKGCFARLTNNNPGCEAFLKVLELTALQHHERWDGKGYPDRLKGTEISLFARIAAIIDIYDALTDNSRTYRDGKTHLEVVDTMLTHVRDAFEPALLDIFLGQNGQQMNTRITEMPFFTE